MKHFDTFDYDLSQISQEANQDLMYNRKHEVSDKSVNRNELFFTRRYRINSYKARKAGISRPSVMMKYGNDKFRLYGNPENNKLFDHAKGILASWKQKNRLEMRALKLAQKKKSNSNEKN